MNDFLTLRCHCCRSDRIVDRPLGLHGFKQCLSCGFIFKIKKDDGSDKEEVVHHYQDVDPHENVAQSKQSFFDYVLNRLSAKAIKKTRNILDVGCGFGYFLASAAQRGWTPYGVELVGNAVRGAQTRVGTGNISHGLLKEAEFPNDYFDAVTLWDMLIFVDDPAEELQECYRVMRTGGQIAIRVRNVFFQKIAFSLYAPIKKIAMRLGVKNPSVFHPFCFTRKSIYLLLQRLGFTNIQVVNSPFTEGDPYGYTRARIFTTAAKGAVSLFSDMLFRVSGGKWVVGPSLLIWAEKPMETRRNGS